MRLSSWLRHRSTSRKVVGSIPDGVISFRLHYGPAVDSASDRDKYQEYFLRGKGGRCVGQTTLPPSCADCLAILMEHSGPVQACTGLASVLILIQACHK